MKKRYGAFLGILVVLAGLFVAQPASADGNWRAYPNGFTKPANWTCGTTVSGPRLSAQTCVVRSGNYVQSATIVRNRTSTTALTEVSARLIYDGDAPDPLASADCPMSGVGAMSVSVCFSPTVNYSSGASSMATVLGVSGALFSPYV